MCFHAAQQKKVKDIERRYEVTRTEAFEIAENDFSAYHLNGFQHPEMLIIPQQGVTKVHPAIWGIMPKNEKGLNQNEYFKKAARFGGGLNAQSEKAFNHFIYKHSIFEKRCIIPVTGFFEPHEHNKKKYPFYFTSREDDFLSIAGIYSLTVDGYVTFTMLTKEASPLFEKIHNTKKRQVVLLDKELEKEWLRDDLNQTHIQELIDVEYNDDTIEAYPISKDLFSPRVDSNHEDIIQKVDYSELTF